MTDNPFDEHTRLWADEFTYNKDEDNMAILTTKQADITLEKKNEFIIIRLVDGTALEIYGNGRVSVYTEHGGEFSHDIPDIRQHK